MLEVRPWGAEYLAEAAALVAARVEALRGQVPLLPSRCTQPDVILNMLQDLPSGMPGAIAARGGRLVGFVAGFALDRFLGRPTAYSPEWANGAASGESRRIYEELYRRLSGEWVDSGYSAHALTLLAHDREALEAWQWLGFGLLNVDGLRSLAPLGGAPTGMAIRRAGPPDCAAAQALENALTQHMAAPPIFWPHDPSDLAAWLADPAMAIWLAFAGGEAVGYMAVGPIRDNGATVNQDDRTAGIVGAFTAERQRGCGVAQALLGQVLAWARQEGYQRCAVDFESMNSLAARFWIRFFTPVAYSLRRGIDTAAPPP